VVTNLAIIQSILGNETGESFIAVKFTNPTPNVTAFVNEQTWTKKNIFHCMQLYTHSLISGWDWNKQTHNWRNSQFNCHSFKNACPFNNNKIFLFEDFFWVITLLFCHKCSTVLRRFGPPNFPQEMHTALNIALVHWIGAHFVKGFWLRNLNRCGGEIRRNNTLAGTRAKVHFWETSNDFQKLFLGK
jgi:hypothetical protein